MSIPSSPNQLPSDPSLDHLKYQARNLRKAYRAGDADALDRLRHHVPRLRNPDPDDAPGMGPTLGDAQLVIAREYGFASWRALKRHVDALAGPESAPAAQPSTHELIEYFGAVRDQDLAALRRCLDANPVLTQARINDEGMSLRGEAFADFLQHEPLTDRNSTAIHLAANSFLDYPEVSPGKSVDLVRVLLEYGADPDAVGFNENTGHCTPIVIVSWEGGMEKMRLLLEAGADVSGDQGVASLRTAANHAKTDRFDLLVEYGAPSTPWLLIRGGLTDRVIDLVDEDPSLLTHRDDRGYTLLQAAAARIDHDAGFELAQAGRTLAEALIERGAEVIPFPPPRSTTRNGCGRCCWPIRRALTIVWETAERPSIWLPWQAARARSPCCCRPAPIQTGMTPWPEPHASTTRMSVGCSSSTAPRSPTGRWSRRPRATTTRPAWS